jgi:hypothetical protein
MAAAALVLAIAAGWYTARFTRARRDLAGAKDGVKKARVILGVERRAFAIVATIVFFTVWWWLDSHS